jgi:hypothetical protein
MRDTLAQNKRHNKALKDQVIQLQLSDGAPQNNEGQSSHNRHRKHHQPKEVRHHQSQYHQHPPGASVEKDVDTNQGLLERYVQLQQQTSWQEKEVQHPHQKPLMNGSDKNGVLKRKQSISSASIRSQSAGSNIPPANNDVFFPNI